MNAMPDTPLHVIALGGNALIRRGERGTIEEQTAHAREALAPVAELAATGARIVVTHGNGPIVGNILLRNEAAAASVHPMPLYIADADSEGGIGFVLQYTLRNLMREAGVDRTAATIVTQVVVDPADPAFLVPSKPVGPHYEPDRAAELAALEGWMLTEVASGVWRRVVPSPRPVRIIEAGTAKLMTDAGVIVIAAGGGGIPVTEDTNGIVSPVDAVVDKDWTSALLACDLDADSLAILMEADALYRDWSTPHASRIARITAAEADEMLASGQLATGSIAPKVAACAHFARTTGREAVMCAAEDLTGAIAGTAGTHVVPY